jgi:hypothetical protein
MWKAVPLRDSITKWLSANPCFKSRGIGLLLIGLATVIAMIIAVSLPRIPQDLRLRYALQILSRLCR